MKGLLTFLFIVLLWAHLLVNVTHASHLRFDREFHITSGPQNVYVSDDGNRATLVLDKKTGVGAQVVSNSQYLFGRFDVRIKLTPDKKRRSAGTIIASYFLASSYGDGVLFNYFPIDNGKGYMLQTDIHINGRSYGGDNFLLPFDPTKDYHKYSIFWNKYHIVFKVDDATYTEFRNSGWMTTPMSLVTKIDARDWLTQSADDAVETDNDDPSKIPSSATFKDVKIDASVWIGSNIAGNYSEPSESKWWNNPKYNELTSKEMEDMKKVREKRLVLD